MSRKKQNLFNERIIGYRHQINAAAEALAFDLKHKRYWQVGECAKEIADAVQKYLVWVEAGEAARSEETKA